MQKYHHYSESQDNGGGLCPCQHIVILGDDVQPTNWEKKQNRVLHGGFIWVKSGGELNSTHCPLIELGHCWITPNYPGTVREEV